MSMPVFWRVSAIAFLGSIAKYPERSTFIGVQVSEPSHLWQLVVLRPSLQVEERLERIEILGTSSTSEDSGALVLDRLLNKKSHSRYSDAKAQAGDIQSSASLDGR